MAKKGGEHNKWTVPSDWNEETDGFQIVALCIPNSRQWRGIFIGQISDLAYGRNYNRNTGTITDAQSIAREIFESMSMACLDDVLIALQCICDQQTILAEKTGELGQTIDDPASDGETSIGPGEQFPSLSAYEIAKCNSANGIYDTILETVTWLKQNNVDLLAGVFGGITSGLLLALTLSGPVGWAIALTGSVLSGLAGYLVSVSVNFTDLEAAIMETHDETVQALFESTDANEAEADFITAVEGAATPITPVESALLEIMLSFEMVNNLFLPRSDLALYESPDPVLCTAFCKEIYLVFGTELFLNQFQAEQAPAGNWGIDIAIWYDGTIGCGDDTSETITIDSLVGWTNDTHNPGFDDSFRYSSLVAGGGADCTDWDVHCSDVEPVGGQLCRRVNIRSDTQFTMDISVA